MRGACDGCLARVDGVPNVMTCLVRARGGEYVETQNVLGTRGADLLRASDFLFPHGIDHHRLFAGVRGLSKVLQDFARNVAGLGRLPNAALAARPARYTEVDVLIVGGGAAGLAAAARLGRRARLVDYALELGGASALLDPARAQHLIEAARSSGSILQSETMAAAIYRSAEAPAARPRVLLVHPEGAELVRATAIIVATGRHDPVLAFENNDLPAVLSARAGLQLWRAGIAIGRRIGLAGDGRFARVFASLVNQSVEVVTCDPANLLRAVGQARVSGIVVRGARAEERIKLDALLVDTPAAPAVQLLIQSGAHVIFTGSGWRPELEPDGRAAPGVWCAGSVAGELSADSASDGERIAQSVAHFSKQL
jgi:sarcosine oxidase subunit alpha